MKTQLARASVPYRIRSLAPLRLLSAALLLWSSFSSASNNTINIGCYGPYKLEMDANRSIEISMHHIMYEIFDPLLFTHASGQYLPGSARSWEVSSDGKTYTFFLNPDALWSDGEPVIAQNFVDGWTRCIRWKEDCIQDLFRGIEGADTQNAPSHPVSGLVAEDPHTLVITLSKPFAIDLATFNNLKFSPFPSHLDIPFDQPWSSKAHWVSNGPLKIHSATKERVEFVKNEHYQGPYPASIDKLIYIADPSGKTHLPDYTRGDIHGVCNVYGNQDPWLSKHLPEHIVEIGTSRASYLSLNLNHPKLQNASVRAGLFLAVEEHRDQLIGQLDIHNAQPLRGIVPENYLSYRSEIASYNAILRRHPDALSSLQGLELSLILADRPTQHIIGRFLKRAWKKYGVELDTQYSRLSLLERVGIMEQGKVDALYATWYPDYASPRSFLTLLDSAAPYASFFRDSQYSNKLTHANNQLDIEDRFRAYAQAEAFVVQEKMPIIGLYSERVYILLKPDIQQNGILSNFPPRLRFGSLKMAAKLPEHVEF